MDSVREAAMSETYLAMEQPPKDADEVFLWTRGDLPAGNCADEGLYARTSTCNPRTPPMPNLCTFQPLIDAQGEPVVRHMKGHP